MHYNSLSFSFLYPINFLIKSIGMKDKYHYKMQLPLEVLQAHVILQKHGKYSPGRSLSFIRFCMFHLQYNEVQLLGLQGHQ